MRTTLLNSAALLSILICDATSANLQQPATVPSGAALRVRTLDPIDLNSTRPGARFRGSLADPVKSGNGAVLIPRRAPVQLSVVNVRRSGRIRGRDRIDLKVDSITFKGKAYPVVSTIAESKGRRRGRRTLEGTGIGAGAGGLIGGIAGGGVGLAVGALVGGAGGTAVAAASADKHLRIPAETVLSFQFQSPLRVK